MTSDLAIGLSFALLALTVAVALSRLERARRERREEAFRSEARARGWQFEAADEGAFRVMRWRGITDHVTWTAEYRRRTRKRNQRHGSPFRFVWWADTLRGPSSPILFMGVPRGKETPAFRFAQGDGLVARLAQKAAGFSLDLSISMYFGPDAGNQVDAGALKPVEPGAPPGFVVMATDPSEGTRLLLGGWSEAMSAQTRDVQSALSDEQRPWVLLLPRRVSLARMGAIRSAADVERFARAGASLVKRT